MKEFLRIQTYLLKWIFKHKVTVIFINIPLIRVKEELAFLFSNMYATINMEMVLVIFFRGALLFFLLIASGSVSSFLSEIKTAHNTATE